MEKTGDQFRFRRMLNTALTMAHVRTAGRFAIRHLSARTRYELRPLCRVALIRIGAIRGPR